MVERARIDGENFKDLDKSDIMNMAQGDQILTGQFSPTETVSRALSEKSKDELVAMVTQLDNELRAANNRIEDLKEKLEEKNDLLSDMASDKTDIVELKKLNARYMAAADRAIRDKHELDNTLPVDLAEAIKPILNEHLDPAAKSLSSLQESIKN